MLQEAFPWGFHPYQEIIETNVQILDLLHLLAPLELDEAYQVLNKAFEGFKPLSNLITPSEDITMLSMKGADLLVNGISRTQFYWTHHWIDQLVPMPFQSLILKLNFLPSF